MAVKNFITLENLSVYDSLIKQVISDEDAKSIKGAALNGKKLELYTIENPTSGDIPRFSITLPFVEREIQGTNGKALIFNEADGGGAKFEHKNNLASFVGVNDGAEGEIAAQIYAVKKVDGKNVGSRINVTTNGIYYTSGKNSAAYSADDEIATKRDVQGDASSKTVYLVDSSSGQSEYAKVYNLYQGSDSSDMSKNNLVGTINIPKDLFVKSGAVRTVIIADEPYEGAVIGDKYIDLQIQNQDEHLYIPANSLVDIYTGGTTSEITISIGNNNEITAAINEIDGSKLADGSVAKIKLVSAVRDSLDLADSALQEDDISGVSTSDIEALFA